MVGLRVLASTLTVAIIGMSLSGCSDINGLFPLTPQQVAQEKAQEKQQKVEKLTAACDNADVLLSDLSQSVTHPVYSLLPGVVCHG